MNSFTLFSAGAQDKDVKLYLDCGQMLEWYHAHYFRKGPLDSFDQTAFAAIDMLSVLVFFFLFFLDHPCKFNCDYFWEMTHGVSN